MNQSLEHNPGKEVSPYSTSKALIEGVSDENQPGLLDYWRIIYKHKWSILAFTVLGILTAILIIKTTTPLYQSTSRLLVEPIAQNKQASLGAYEYVKSPRLFYQTQYEIITSRNIAKQVIRNLDLLNDKRFTSSITDEKEMFAPDKSFFSSPMAHAQLSTSGKLELYVDKLLNGLRVSGGSDSQIFNIKYQAVEPMLASDVANAVADAYINFGVTSRTKGAVQATDWLTQQEDELRVKLENSEAKLQEYKNTHRMLGTGSNQAISKTKLSSLAKQLIAAQSSRSDAEVRYNQILAINNKGDLNSISSILNNNVVVKLKQAELDQAREVSELSQRYGAKHPKLVTAKTKLRQAKKAVRRVVNQIVANLRKEVELTKAREQKIRSLMAREEASARDYQIKDFQLGKLEQAAAYNRRMYEEFLAKASDIESKTKFSVSNITILDPAHPIFKPFSPNIKRLLILCTIAGAFLGVFLAFLRG